MHKILLAAGVMLTLVSGTVNAKTVSDPTGDFLPSFIGDHDADLDVKSFTVDYDAMASIFTLSATLAGTVDPSKPGLYVIGVNTGSGLIAPFGGIGEPNVIFNQVIAIQKTGAGAVSGHTLGATIAGDAFSLVVPLSFLPSTGFTPQDYGFNLWPRNGLGQNSQISDFAPQNATLSVAPEATTWAMLVVGFGLAGVAARVRRRQALAA